MVFYMISDSNGNLLLMGSPKIKIPEKMFFMAKNGKVRQAPTTTKNGALSMRGGVRSIKLIPSSNGLEVVKMGKTLQDIKNKQNKKESKKLLKEMMGTKTSKKIEMPELPEPKPKPKPKPKPEPEPENEDIISGNLQKLIYTSSIDKIKKALVDLKYKGRIQTNKVMLNMQLLQNLDINKQKELIKLLQ